MAVTFEAVIVRSRISFDLWQDNIRTMFLYQRPIIRPLLKNMLNRPSPKRLMDHLNPRFQILALPRLLKRPRHNRSHVLALQLLQHSGGEVAAMAFFGPGVHQRLSVRFYVFESLAFFPYQHIHVYSVHFAIFLQKFHFDRLLQPLLINQVYLIVEALTLRLPLQPLTGLHWLLEHRQPVMIALFLFDSLRIRFAVLIVLFEFALNVPGSR